MAETALERAGRAAGQSDADRLRFYEALADTMLFVLLEGAPEGDNISPQVLSVENDQLALVFDSELRLADFAGEAAYAEIPGRVLAQMLGQADLGLMLNAGGAADPLVLQSASLRWLTSTLEGLEAEQIETRIERLLPPGDLPEKLLTALDGKLARAAGLARCAYLCATRDNTGGVGHLLAIIGANHDAEPALVGAVNEALSFSGIEAAVLDVGFFAPDHPICARLEPVALRFDLTREVPEPAAPGSDPARPPRLV